MGKAKRIFLFAYFSLFIPNALALGSHSSSIWKSLLHRGRYFSTNPDFYLSKSYDELAELELSKRALKTDPSWKCHFPARAFFIHHYLNKERKELSFESCSKLASFIKRAPARQISLVYASEKMNSPESGLGHTLIKISNADTLNPIEHAFSFWTKVNDVDPLTLIVKAFVTGKKGFFTMSSFSEITDFYLQEEERDLWEYQLDLDPAEKELIHYHLYELKSVDFQYSFHGYNCSTFIKEIMKVGIEKLNIGGLWTTPKDLIFDLKNLNLIRNTVYHPSHASIILQINSDTDIERSALEKIKLYDFSKISFSKNSKSYLTFLLAHEYLSYQYSEGSLNFKQFKSKMSDLKKNSSMRLGEYDVEFSGVDPKESSSDGQVALNYHSDDNVNLWGLTLLPAGHFLFNQTQSTYENEYQLGSLQVLYNTTRKKIFVNRFNLIKIKSLQPVDRLIGGSSFALSIGYQSVLDRDFKWRRASRFLYGIGRTYRIHRDIDVYGLLNIEALKNRGLRILRDKVETGLILREVFNLKTILTANVYSSASSKRIYNAELIQAYNGKSFSIFAKASLDWQNSRRMNFFSLNTSYFF